MEPTASFRQGSLKLQLSVPRNEVSTGGLSTNDVIFSLWYKAGLLLQQFISVRFPLAHAF